MIKSCVTCNKPFKYTMFKSPNSIEYSCNSGHKSIKEYREILEDENKEKQRIMELKAKRNEMIDFYKCHLSVVAIFKVSQSKNCKVII